jgi:hypothetical protein
MIGSTVTSRPQTPPAARTQPGPTYNAFDCVHLSTDCGGFNPATAIPQSSRSFYPLHGVDMAWDGMGLGGTRLQFVQLGNQLCRRSSLHSASACLVVCVSLTGQGVT